MSTTLSMFTSFDDAWGIAYTKTGGLPPGDPIIGWKQVNGRDQTFHSKEEALEACDFDGWRGYVCAYPSTPVRTRPAPRVLNYFGSKVNAAKHYPAPTESKIVEPFAGGAGYSLYWCDHEVSLYDLNSDVIRAWDYLIKTSRQELLSIPLLEMGADARDLPCCEEARLLVRWTTNQASNPINNLCSYAKVHPNSYWGEFRRARTAAVAEQIRHWKVYCESWENSEREGKATYFVDPPYQGSKLGKCYKYNVVDFEALAAFCQSRDGQVIVCDTADATWLPFKPFRTAMGTAQKGGLSKKTSPEGIWVKETT